MDILWSGKYVPGFIFKLHHNAIFIQTILNSLNFSTKFDISKTSIYGRIKKGTNPNSISSGMFTAIEKRMQEVTYTIPVYVSDTYSMVRTKTLDNTGLKNIIKYPFKPMDVSTWICFTISTLLLILLINTIRYCKKGRLRDLDWTEIKGDTFWEKDVGIASITVLKMFWTFLIIFSFSQFYGAILMTNSIESCFPRPRFSSLKEIKRAFVQDDLEYATHRNVYSVACAAHDLKNITYSYDICEELGSVVTTSSIGKSIKYVQNYANAIGDIGGDEYLMTMLPETACDLWPIPTNFFGPLMASYIVPKNMSKAILERINRQILYGVSIREHLLKKKAKPWIKCFMDKSVRNPELLPFTLDNIGPVLWLWVAGITAGLVAFSLECLMYLRMNNKFKISLRSTRKPSTNNLSHITSDSQSSNSQSSSLQIAPDVSASD